MVIYLLFFWQKQTKDFLSGKTKVFNLFVIGLTSDVHIITNPDIYVLRFTPFSMKQKSGVTGFHHYCLFTPKGS